METSMIKFNNLSRQYENIRDELLDAADVVYRSGFVLDGPYAQQFEREIAKRCNRRHAVAVGSGTQALIFAQKILFKNATKILVPSISFVATLNSVLMERHEPVFCDVDKNGLMDLESLDYAIDGAGIEGIMYVNLFGNTVDYERFWMISQFFSDKIKIIEDAAQSFGAWHKRRPSGSLGDVSVLSFDPTKNLPNYGSGGMVLVDDMTLADEVRSLRNNGKKNFHEDPGTNSQMSEADCAQMLVKLRYFDKWQSRRSDIARYYTKMLEDCVDVPSVTEGTDHAWHKYVIRTSNRSRLSHELYKLNIETKIHYPRALYEYPVGFNHVGRMADMYKEAGAFCDECLSLPIYPELTDLEVEWVANTVRKLVQP